MTHLRVVTAVHRMCTITNIIIKAQNQSRITPEISVAISAPRGGDIRVN